MPEGLAPRLAAIVGAGHVSAGGPAVDGVAPGFAVRPGDAEQVSRLLTLAHGEGLAVVPRGGGSALGLGNPPARADLLLDLTRLNRVVEYEPADVSISVEAGITLEDLGEVLGKQRQFLPLDPPGWRARTVGGVLATNASGPLRPRYGAGRDLLLGVRFVQADGTVTWGGSRVVKSVTGYDVPKLLTGSLGTLGVIVETTLRLHPVAEYERSWLFGFPALAAAAGFLAGVADSALQPSRVEVLNAAALHAIGRPASPAAVAVSVGSVEEAVRAQGEALAGLAARAGGAAAAAGDDFWDAYGTAAAQVAPGGVRLRIACLASSVTDVVGAVEALAGAQGLRARTAGCAGVGALTAILEGECPAEAWVAELLEPLRQRLAGEGGSAVVEACPRALKERIDVWGSVDPAALDLMRRIKREFDPEGVLNPGRFVGRL